MKVPIGMENPYEKLKCMLKNNTLSWLVAPSLVADLSVTTIQKSYPGGAAFFELICGIVELPINLCRRHQPGVSFSLQKSWWPQK